MALPRLLWDLGTAYDFFVSQVVLHHPADYGVRGAWAAGVRARLSVAERETLKKAQSLFLSNPLHWIYQLPDPKDAATVLWALGRIPPADRLGTLSLSPSISPQVRKTLLKVASNQAWEERDRQIVQANLGQEKGSTYFSSYQGLDDFLTEWSQASEFGERYLQALRSYHDVFYAEEEERIRPALQSGLERAQELAQRSPMPELLEKLSQGLRFADLSGIEELVLAPSFWSTPIVFFGEASAGRSIWLFGAKPADASLVPGEVVPDTLLRTLKALSDPTRLRILRYLTDEPLTPSELARRLRLRIPTVTHHLRTLRVAGLVQLTVEKTTLKEPDLFTTRVEPVDVAFSALKSYLGFGEGP